MTATINARPKKHGSIKSEYTPVPLREAVARYERWYLCYALERAGGDKAKAARLLNISLRTFYRKLAKYNL